MICAKIKSSMFRGVVDAISEIVDSAVMTFTASGIVLQAMDASHVSLCFLDLKSDGFVEYGCARDVVSVGVPITTMSRIFKCSTTEDNLCIKIEDGKLGDTMSLEFSNSCRTSKFHMRLMHIDSEFIDLPEMACVCSLKLPTSEFQKIVRDLSTIGETCELRVDETGVVFTSSGDMSDASLRVVERDDDVCFEGKGCGKFSTKYLQLFAKATPLCKSLSITLPEGAPLCLEYSMGVLGTLRYYLAPKLGDDDNDD